MKVKTFLISALKIFFCLFAGSLFILSLRYVFITDMSGYSEFGTKVSRNPLITVIGIAFILGIVWLFSQIAKAIPQKAAHILFFILIGICALFSVFAAWKWIRIDTFNPTADQYTVWKIAEAAVSGEPAGRDLIEYIQQYPHQSGMVWIETILIRIFGDYYEDIWYLNLICCGCIVLGFTLLSYNISGSKRAALLTSVATACFVPIPVYSKFVYGTLFAVTCMIYGMLFVIFMLRAQGRKSIVYAVLSLLCLIMGYISYRAVLIAIAAVIVFILFFGCIFGHDSIKKKLLYVIFCCLIAISMKCSSDYCDSRISQELEIETSEGIPYNAWILMGITSFPDSDMPGSYTSASLDMYKQNKRNSETVSRAIHAQIRQAAFEYLTGKRSLSFFVKKIEYEWLDPLFSSIAMTVNSPDTSGPLHSFLYGSIFKVLQVIMSYFLPTIYFLSTLCAIWIKDRKKDAILLCMLFFAGGFLYCLLSEGKSRYAFPFFLILIPLACCSANHILEVLETRYESHKISETK